MGNSANFLPQDKAVFIEDLTGSGLKTVMVGDEINDALALSKEATGVTMGAGGFPLAAGLIHVIHTLGSMLNSSRLLGWHPVEKTSLSFQISPSLFSSIFAFINEMNS